ncbi:MAG TPA: hypothetical protein VGE62_01930 [Candidatus Paceibacterota bacterium]
MSKDILKRSRFENARKAHKEPDPTWWCGNSKLNQLVWAFVVIVLLAIFAIWALKRIANAADSSDPARSSRQSESASPPGGVVHSWQ